MFRCQALEPGSGRRGPCPLSRARLTHGCRWPALLPAVRKSMAPPSKSNTLRPLAALSWKRPNIGSRMNREVHVRIWERPEVRALRATRHQRSLARGRASDMVSLPGIMTGQILGGVRLAEAVKIPDPRNVPA